MELDELLKITGRTPNRRECILVSALGYPLQVIIAVSVPDTNDVDIISLEHSISEAFAKIDKFVLA